MCEHNETGGGRDKPPDLPPSVLSTTHSNLPSSVNLGFVTRGWQSGSWPKTQADAMTKQLHTVWEDLRTQENLNTALATELKT